MDASASEIVAAIKHLRLPEQSVLIPASPPKKHKPLEECSKEDFLLAASPSIFLHVLTDYGLDAQTLARLEATCTFFRRPAQLSPDTELPLSEVAALDMCYKRAIFKPMTTEERQHLKQRCGGSWKLVLRFFLAGEACTRRGKAVPLAGPGHSIALAKNGDVYSFGANSFGELGNGTTEDQTQPCLIRSLAGVRIIQASVAFGITLLISDAGRVYAFGRGRAVIGNFFTAFLSREGRVYTVSWGKDGKLAHNTDMEDLEPRPLLGALENVPVVQISAGYCYLLALTCQPGGMSVYSVGCGLGGKLGHGVKADEAHPRLIEEFRTLNLQPKMISAGAWHSAVVGADGRVFTWGWGLYGCLGHGDEECQSSPKLVQALANVKAAYVAAGDYMTFVVSEGGDVYSCGWGETSSLGHTSADNPEGNEQRSHVLTPELVASLKKLGERIVHISITNSVHGEAHTFALAESGKLYAFGAGRRGQLGVKLGANVTERCYPELINIDLS
uniref:RCC1-like domain-containing protein n=1 Tax=Kalanchoe fedtschenkoi TaxID=63787 RepID=A0A7N0VHT3_KALFE